MDWNICKKIKEKIMIQRDLTTKLQELAQSFAVIAALGPRQSGKTTLVRAIFDKHAYVSLEDFDVRERAIHDPRGFLKEYTSGVGVILDEIQHVPHLLSYIQTIVDEEQQKPGRFIITGSQNILVNEAITQTLAGRMAIVRLFPLSLHELNHVHLTPSALETAIFNGFYPRIYANSIRPEIFYKNYIDTYLERDVRQIKNIVDLSTFQRFIQLCAARTGQLLNIASLSADCGIDQKTARSWLSILEATYIIFLLQPHFKNFGKRLIKSPKLYFVDTGLVCSLLEFRDEKEVGRHYLRGNLVENFIMSDLFKQYHNLDIRPPLYFWADQTSEIDCLIEQALRAIPLEIKASMTVTPDFFKQLQYWRRISDSKEKGYVIYGGNQDQTWSDQNIEVVSWHSAGNLIKSLENKD